MESESYHSNDLSDDDFEFVLLGGSQSYSEIQL